MKTLKRLVFRDDIYLCASGEMLCGECKKEVIEKLQKWMKEHQEKKKKLVPKAEKMLEEE